MAARHSLGRAHLVFSQTCFRHTTAGVIARNALSFPVYRNLAAFIPYRKLAISRILHLTFFLRASPRNSVRTERRHLLISLAIATLYAISDEFHQSFVRSRGANVIDVLIDMCGGISGIFWSHRRNRGKGLP